MRQRSVLNIKLSPPLKSKTILNHKVNNQTVRNHVVKIKRLYSVKLLDKEK